MSENKKRISKAQIIVIVSIVVAIAAVIVLSLSLHAKEPQGIDCCPWCFGACPWCWLIVAIAIIIVYACILLAMTAAARVVVAAAAAVATAPRHKAQRNVNIPRQKKDRRRNGHTLRHAKQYDATVSLHQLTQAFEEGSTVTIEKLKEMGLVPMNADGYKVLVSENEKLAHPLIIYATSFSAQAKDAILEGGGQAVKVYS